MNTNIEKMLAYQGEELQLAKEAIETEINNHIEEGREKGNNEAFLEYAIDHLMGTNVIPTPESADDQHEYVRVHPYEGNLRANARFRIDGSALFRSDDGYRVHFFIVDYDPGKEVHIITFDEIKRLAQMAKCFEDGIFGGKLLPSIHPMQSVYETAKTLYSLKDQIVGARIWVLTNRLYDGDSGGYFKKSYVPETTYSVASLKNLAPDGSGSAGISQAFPEGGLPCLEVPRIGDQDYSCFMTTIDGTTLAQLYRIHGTRLIQANVRAHLGDRNTVNQKIRQAADKEPERFLAYNNGIVMSANGVEVGEGCIKKILDLQIINGGQTTATLYHYLRSAQKEEERERRRQNLAKLRVPMKIIVADPSAFEADIDELRNAITRAANSQTKVKVSDLSANSPFQREFAEIANNMTLPDGSHLYYERALKQFEAEVRSKETPALSRAFRQRFTDPETKKPRIIQKPDLAVALLLWEGNVQIVAKGREAAYAFFASRLEEKPIEVNRHFVQESLSKVLILSILERKAKRELGIQNPRVPAIYAFSLFAQHYGARVKLDRVWARQGISYDLERVLLDITADVYQIMKKNMGEIMISMWGRRKDCLLSLQREFDINKFSVDHVNELS